MSKGISEEVPKKIWRKGINASWKLDGSIRWYLDDKLSSYDHLSKSSDNSLFWKPTLFNFFVAFPLEWDDLEKFKKLTKMKKFAMILVKAI